MLPPRLLVRFSHDLNMTCGETREATAEEAVAIFRHLVDELHSPPGKTSAPSWFACSRSDTDGFQLLIDGPDQIRWHPNTPEPPDSWFLGFFRMKTSRTAAVLTTEATVERIRGFFELLPG